MPGSGLPARQGPRTGSEGKISPVLYVCGIAFAWLVSAWVGLAFFVFVALLWLVPDRRLERIMAGRPHS